MLSIWNLSFLVLGMSVVVVAGLTHEYAAAVLDAHPPSAHCSDASQCFTAATDLLNALTHSAGECLRILTRCVSLSVCHRFRLRKKTWKNPGTVFLDYHVYEEDINISSNWEVFLEVLEGEDHHGHHSCHKYSSPTAHIFCHSMTFLLVEPERMKSMSQLAVLTRRWCPAQMKLEAFREVVLESSSVEELKEKVCGI